MIKMDELVEVYNDYDNNIYLPTVDKVGGIGYELRPKYDGEPNPVQVYWKDVVNIHRISSVFKNGMVRFYNEDIEVEAYKQLRISQVKGINLYTREKIEEMIVNCNDDVLQEIIDIKDLKIINLFYNILVGLQNSNVYDISSRVDIYIRARKEELENKEVNSSLEVLEGQTIEFAVVEETTEEVEEIEEEIVAKVEKPKTTKKTKTETRPKAKAKTKTTK